LFFLLGPSGSGKTTLLRCLAGFQMPDEGTISIDGQDITRVPPHLRGTAMVFQSYALWPHMTLRENVAFGLEVRRLSREEIRRRTDEALAQVQLLDRADARPAQLSGGQQQRIALARALVVQPRCLLLDEPLSNLDARLREDMRVEIRRICKGAGITAIYVTHDQKEALSMADRLAVLNQGRVEQVGRPAELYGSPVNRFVAGFIGETNFIPGHIERADGETLVVRTRLGLLRARRRGVVRAQPADPITLSIRPECLRLDPAPAGAANMLEGQIRSTAYLGEVARHEIEVNATAGSGEAGPGTLTVFEIRPARGAPENGPVPVRLWVEATDVHALDR
jgi:iron(III) transport system ATP-binding protein